MPKLNAMYPKTYATADDIQEPVTVTIRAVVQDEVYLPWEKKHVNKWALVFAETRRKIIMGRKLAFEIGDILGDDTDDWTDRQITLYSEPISVAGKMRRTIRARAPEPANGTYTEPEPDETGEADGSW